MAILCSTDEDLVIVKRPKQGDRRGPYWKMEWADERQVQGQHAVELLALNAKVFGIKPESVAPLEAVQKLYHPDSHCGRVTIEHRAAIDPPRIYNLGGISRRRSSRATARKYGSASSFVAWCRHSSTTCCARCRRRRSLRDDNFRG